MGVREKRQCVMLYALIVVNNQQAIIYATTFLRWIFAKKRQFSGKRTDAGRRLMTATPCLAVGESG
jgi:hypothetical protein